MFRCYLFFCAKHIKSVVQWKNALRYVYVHIHMHLHTVRHVRILLVRGTVYDDLTVIKY